MEVLPAAEPLRPDAVASSPAPSPAASPAAASPAAPASSKKHGRELAEVLCAFCHEGEDSDDPDEDPIVPVETGRAKQHYAHENCIWWCPDVWQDKDLKWQNVGKSLSRCHRLKCAVCGEGDAPLGCKRAACRKNWHYPCAMEPTTGLVILEEEFCVACVVCNELLIRRARKKQLAVDLKKAQKQALAATKPTKASKSPAARGWNDTVSPATGGGTPGASSSKTMARHPSSSAKAPKGGMAPPPVPPKSSKKLSAAAQAAARAVSLQAEAQAAAAAYRPAPSAPPLPPPPPAPPPPPPNLRFEAAAKAMNALFSKMRTEDLPLETVRAGVELSEGELDELLEQLDQDNKVMCRSGVVYLI